MKLQKEGGGMGADTVATGHSLWPELSSFLCKLRLLLQLVEPSTRTSQVKPVN